MEDIENKSSKEKETRPTTIIDIFRHGEAFYKQKILNGDQIEQADDLTPSGREMVKRQAEHLVTEIRPDEEITIYSSPYGRTLQTARIIADVFRKHGLKIRAKNDEEKPYSNIIRVLKVLKEVDKGL